jgi:hypothetical protein
VVDDTVVDDRPAVGDVVELKVDLTIPGTVGAGRITVGAELTVAEAFPEKKLARAATILLALKSFGPRLVPSTWGGGGAGRTTVDVVAEESSASILSALSKLESTGADKGDKVHPLYWPIKLVVSEDDAGAAGATFDPFRCRPLNLVGRKGKGRDISTLFRALPLLLEAAEAGRDEDLFHSQVTGRQNGGRWCWMLCDGDDVVELFELGGCVKSGLPRVLREREKK